MTEDIPDQMAFAYLSDIRKKFIQTYHFEKIPSFHAYQLNEFVDILKHFMVSNKFQYICRVITIITRLIRKLARLLRTFQRLRM